MRFLSVVFAAVSIILSENSVAADPAVEKHEFQAEMHRLMDIIINSLYSHKEVFLRELVSNAHDAVEKARYLSLSDPDYLNGHRDLEIRIEFDDDEKTLSITDTGVGMTKADLINNLGTVAKSGTTNFIEKMSESGGQDSSLIGQFGVGFYSAFLVADKVKVVSKSNADSKQYAWESSAASSFTIAEDEGEDLGRGTKIVLYMKEDATEFLNGEKIKELVNKFSQFIPFPIKVRVPKTVEEEVPIEESEEEEKASEEEKKDEDMEVEDEDQEEKPKTKKVSKTVLEWDHVNTAKPIWMRPRDQITDADYTEFYKAISKDYQDALAHTHFSAEGQTEFRSILFIPKRAPHNMMDNYWKKKNDIKLYVRRVMVADKLDDMLPAYLGSFVRGMVDSDDLPLNVNREQLQHSKVLRVISKKLVKKVLDLLKDLAKESEGQTEEKDEEEEEEGSTRTRKEKKEGEKSDWELFYEQYSTQLKLGCYEDDANRERVAKLLRFNTWKSPSNVTSLDAYIKAAGGEEAKFIYYMSGDSIEVMQKSPALQAFKKRAIDVLLLHDNLDEPCIQRLSEYGGKKFVSIQKADVQLPETPEEKKRFKKLKKMYRPLTDWWKERLSAEAGVKIESVVVSKRLVDAPCVVVSSQWGHSAQQERVMKSQAFQQKDEFGMMMGRKTFEINPNHPVIVDLLSRVGKDKSDESALDTASVLFQAALLDSGYEISDPSALVSRVYRLMSVQLGVDPEAVVTEVEVPEGDEEESETAPSEEEEVNFDSSSFEDIDWDDDVAAKSEEDHDEL